MFNILTYVMHYSVWYHLYKWYQTAQSISCRFVFLFSSVQKLSNKSNISGRDMLKSSKNDICNYNIKSRYWCCSSVFFLKIDQMPVHYHIVFVVASKHSFVSLEELLCNSHETFHFFLEETLSFFLNFLSLKIIYNNLEEAFDTAKYQRNSQINILLRNNYSKESIFLDDPVT